MQELTPSYTSSPDSVRVSETTHRFIAAAGWVVASARRHSAVVLGFRCRSARLSSHVWSASIDSLRIARDPPVSDPARMLLNVSMPKAEEAPAPEAAAAAATATPAEPEVIKKGKKEEGEEVKEAKEEKKK